MRRVSPNGNHRSDAFRSTEPIHRLLHQRRAQLNAAADLRGQFVEALGPKHARRVLVRVRKHRCHGKMKARLKGDRLVYDSKATIQLFELAAHQGKPTVYRKFVGVIVGPQELSERGFNKRRLACARTFCCGRQPCGHLFR